MEHGTHVSFRCRTFHHDHKARLVGGGAHQPPCAVIHGYAHAVHRHQLANILADQLFAFFPHAGENLHHAVHDLILHLVGAIGRHGGRAPCHGQCFAQIRHLLVRIAVQHVANGDGGDEAVVIAAPDRRVEEIVAGFFEAHQRVDLVGAALDVGMPGLPVIRRGAIGPQYRVGEEEAGRFHIDDEFRILEPCGKIAREHYPHLVGKDFLARIVHHAAAVAIAVKGKSYIRADFQHLVAQRVEHLHIFRVRIVIGEGEVEFAIERDHLRADPFQHTRRKGARRAIAAGGDHLERVFQLLAIGEVLDVALGHVRHVNVAPPIPRFALAFKDDALQVQHLVRPESERALRAHLHARPAILVVARRHHGDGRHVEIELREIGNRRQREPDIVHLASRTHQPDDERLLDGGRVGTEIVPDRDRRTNAHLVQHRAEAEAQCLNAHQVDLLGEQPPCIIFAKPGGSDQRKVLEFRRIGL